MWMMIDFIQPRQSGRQQIFFSCVVIFELTAVLLFKMIHHNVIFFFGLE